MSDLRLNDYLVHIEDAAVEAMGFVRGQSCEAFELDRRTQLAVLMCLVTIGEAAARIAEKYPDFVERNSQLAWREMRGMRNHVVHGYFDIDLQVVWDTLQIELPEVAEQIKALRSSAND